MASLTDAEKALRSTKGKENFQRLTRLLMCGGVQLLREKFDSFHSPTDLPLKLGDPAIQTQLKGAKLTNPMWDCLYPPPSPGTFGKSTDFDITLIFRLLRTICNLTEPSTKWDNLPNSTDYSFEADLARIKFYRNSVYGHNTTMEITDSEFGNLWREISEALLRIAGSISQVKRDEWEISIDELLHDPLTTQAQRYMDELQLWYKNDMEVKDTVEQLRDQVRDQNCLIQQLNQRLGSVLISIGVEEHHQENPQNPPVAELTIWTVILSFKDSFDLLLQYLKVQLGVGVKNYNVGSLLITVTCSSLEILERLWKDYSSGHLNEVAEETLVTAQVLKKLGLDELKLTTTISPDEYGKCREFFLGIDQSAKEDEGLFQLRHELMNYDFQKCPKIKEVAFEYLAVDDIDLIRVAVIGPAGAGKTNLIGTLQRALKEPQTAMDPDLERLEGSIVLEEHYLQKKIRMVDTRGFFLSDEQLEDELLDILSGRLRPGDAIVRNYDKEGDKMANTTIRIDSVLSDYVHAVIFVLNGNDPCLMDGSYRDKLQTLREHLNKEGYAPVTAITCLDKRTLLKKDQDAVLKMAQRTTGSSNQSTHFITIYTSYDEHEMMSYEVDRAALHILDSALVSAERFIQFSKRREKNQMERKAMTGVPSGAESVEQFLARLEKKYNWTNQGRKKALLEDLRKKDITIVKVLKKLWNEIKSELKLSIGMKIGLEEEIKHLGT
ncbi:hypothetical protein ACROYT_G027429 [Oculina patagonica]